MVDKEIRIIFPPILITAFEKNVDIVCGSVVTSKFAAISGLLSGSTVVLIVSITVVLIVGITVVLIVGITVVLIVDSGRTVVVTTSVVVSEQFVSETHLSPYIYFSKQFLALSNF